MQATHHPFVTDLQTRLDLGVRLVYPHQPRVNNILGLDANPGRLSAGTQDRKINKTWPFYGF